MSSITDQSFIDARARVLDVAAFLDRAQRHGEWEDFRLEALRRVIPELLGTDAGRAERVLRALSDHSAEPIAAAPMQGALGAVAVS